MKKAVILDADTVLGGGVSLAPLQELFETKTYSFSTPDEIAERIGDAEAVFTNKCRIAKEVFEKCPNLKFIGVFATGYNNIDVETAKARGCVVANVPGYSTNLVAQHTVALILHYYSQVASYATSVANGDWCKSSLFSYFNYPFFELSGKTLGIVGYGSIGKAVKKIAEAFGMKILVHTRTMPEDTNGIEVVGFEELLMRSDVVTFHCPLTPQTELLINRETLALMKPTALLINTSRGGVINENDLAEALNDGKIAGAGLDVLTVEPMSENCPLKNAKNCYITPHIAWAAVETRTRLIEMVKQNALAYLSGSPINNVAK